MYSRYLHLQLENACLIVARSRIKLVQPDFAIRPHHHIEVEYVHTYRCTYIRVCSSLITDLAVCRALIYICDLQVG